MRTAREIALAVLCSGEKHKDKKRRYFLESPRNARVQGPS